MPICEHSLPLSLAPAPAWDTVSIQGQAARACPWKHKILWNLQQYLHEAFEKALLGNFFFPFWLSAISYHFLVLGFPFYHWHSLPVFLHSWLANSSVGTSLPAGCICYFIRKKSFTNTVCLTIRSICLSHSEITICSGNSHTDLKWSLRNSNKSWSALWLSTLFRREPSTGSRHFSSVPAPASERAWERHFFCSPRE